MNKINIYSNNIYVSIMRTRIYLFINFIIRYFVIWDTLIDQFKCWEITIIIIIILIIIYHYHLIILKINITELVTPLFECNINTNIFIFYDANIRYFICEVRQFLRQFKIFNPFKVKLRIAGQWSCQKKIRKVILRIMLNWRERRIKLKKLDY